MILELIDVHVRALDYADARLYTAAAQVSRHWDATHYRKRPDCRGDIVCDCGRDGCRGSVEKVDNYVRRIGA